MKKSALYLLVAATLAGCAGNQPNPNVGGASYTAPPANGKPETAASAFLTKGSGAKAITAANSFGLKLLQEAAKDKKGDNVLISPISVSTALLMAYNGADGAAQTAMHKALQLDKMRAQDVNSAAKLALELLQQQGDN